MFDFLSYVRDTGVEIKLIPPKEGVLICLEVRELEHNYFERCEITDDQARKCENIDSYTGRVLDRMVANIGKKKAREYAACYQSQQMRDREKIFKGE